MNIEQEGWVNRLTGKPFKSKDERERLKVKKTGRNKKIWSGRILHIKNGNNLIEYTIGLYAPTIN